MSGHDAKASPMPAVRAVSAGAPLTWLARGFADFRAHPLPSIFYGACFALMGWLIAVVFEHAAAYVSSLVVIGARDIMAPPRAAKGLVEALAGARVVTLPDTGHAMMAEQPDAVLDALRGFL